MSDTAYYLHIARKRLRLRDPTLTAVHIFGYKIDDHKARGLLDLLLKYPDALKSINLGYNWLSDKTGVKLARLVLLSSTLEYLELSYNGFTDKTFLAIASALRTNRSLRFVAALKNPINDSDSIDAAFTDALRLNPDRPFRWKLNESEARAEQIEPPSMLLYLDHAQDHLPETKIRTIYFFSEKNGTCGRYLVCNRHASNEHCVC